MALYCINAGMNLQSFLDAAVGGDVLQLEAGATFSGLFTIGQKSDYVRLTGAADIVSTVTSQPALKTVPNARNWRIDGVTFRSIGVSDILRIGEWPNQDADTMPFNIEVDSCTLRGHATLGAHRGVALHGRDILLNRLTIRDVFAVGTESQGIGGWNGSGPYTITNCDIEAGAIGFISGGSPPSVLNQTPTGITITDCRFSRPAAWQSLPYGCKNSFELKHARNVRVSGCLFENVWRQGQEGYAVVLTPRSGPTAFGLTAPWTTVEDVIFSNNVVRNVGAGINTLGSDTNEISEDMNDIHILDNLFDNVNGPTFGSATGRLIQFVNSPRDIEMRRNIVNQTGQLMFAANPNPDDIQQFVFTDNVFRSGSIRGDGSPTNATTLANHFLSPTLLNNRGISDVSGGTLITQAQFDDIVIAARQGSVWY